tara:strand:+ start:582 stop:779 length:198 start_codon:yes stop_codon:yes gene_type:complete
VTLRRLLDLVAGREGGLGAGTYLLGVTETYKGAARRVGAIQVMHIAATRQETGIRKENSKQDGKV